MLHGMVHGSTDGRLHAHISRWMTDGGQVGSVGGGGCMNVGMDGSFMHLAGEEEWRSTCVVCLSEDIPSRSLFCSLYLILTDTELVSQPCSRLPFLPPPPSPTSSVICPQARSPPQCPNLSLSTNSISRHLLDAVVSPASGFSLHLRGCFLQVHWFLKQSYVARVNGRSCSSCPS